MRRGGATMPWHRCRVAARACEKAPAADGDRNPHAFSVPCVRGGRPAAACPQPNRLWISTISTHHTQTYNDWHTWRRRRVGIHAQGTPLALTALAHGHHALQLKAPAVLRWDTSVTLTKDTITATQGPNSENGLNSDWLEWALRAPAGCGRTSPAARGRERSRVHRTAMLCTLAVSRNAANNRTPRLATVNCHEVTVNGGGR